jgi:hypothetical protein
MKYIEFPRSSQKPHDLILNLVGQHDTKAATLIDNNWQVSLQSLLFELLLNHDIKAATLIDNNWQVSQQYLLFELLIVKPITKGHPLDTNPTSVVVLLVYFEFCHLLNSEEYNK